MDPVVIWVYISSFLDLFGVSLLIPLMSIRLKEMGASYFAMGLMTSVYGLTQFLSGPVVGSWSDRMGRRPILLGSVVAVSCCYAVFGLLDSLFLMGLIRSIVGIVKHTQVLLRTIVADRVPEEKRSLAFGYLKAVAGVSFTLGPAVGGHLAELKNGFGYVCFAVSALFLLNGAIGYFLLEDVDSFTKKEDSKASKPPPEKNFVTLAISDLSKVNWAVYWHVFALKFLMDFAAGAYHNNYNLKVAEKFDASPKIAGYTIAVQSFVGVLAGLLVNRISKRFYATDFSYKNRGFHAYSLMTIAYLGTAATGNLNLFVLWSMLIKATGMFLRITFTEMMMNRCPSWERGSVMGAGNSVSSIARFVTPLVAGLVQDFWGSSSADVLAAGAAGLSILVSSRLPEERPKTS